ncbi:protein-arginine deiminase type-2-like [Sinocyclocheilus rhinocerous]|uniref:protein-arginine deiminase type-2-like n=1 Tax=Sinocyclocheilus rhinocerous TaxID=307959 RepID=UPI0007B83AC6|nr:PREDICTED: protein-arginine deiminase type-2-like [Sinocyclocheilus rhinocerous]
MEMSQQQTQSVSLPRSLRKRKKGSDMTNMFQRTCRLEISVPTQIVHVVGTELKVIVDRCAPPQSKSFSIKCGPNVHYKVTPPAGDRNAAPYPLTPNSVLIVTMDAVSETANDSKLSVRYYGEKTESLGDAVLHLTAVEISLDADADRDGVVEKNNPNKGSWKWGPKGHGAVLLVNCDSETTYKKTLDSEVDEISKVSDLQDMSKMILRTNGPAELPEGYKLTMHISQTTSENVRVFRPRTNAKKDDVWKHKLLKLFLKDYIMVVGTDTLTQEVPYLGGKTELAVFVEGLRSPDKDFDGLVTINLSLLEPCGKVSEPATRGRNMTKVVQDFLWAQKVQEPIALYSDWLVVGHVDEFMTFVPAPDRKKFRLLLASPDAGYKVFKSLQNNGHGKAEMFPGLPEAISVNEILSDKKLQAENRYVQNCIDWNRDVLKKELGLDDEDIIDLPILFKVLEEKTGPRAVAYYPDMVNMIVLGDKLGVPKPFGPKVNGRCALETEVCSLLEPLGLKCTFIDDLAPYHKLLGEVHCGSNVLREPSPFKWWNLEL